MRPVSDQRRIKELQARISILTRDTPCKIHLMHIKLIVETIKLILNSTRLGDKGYKNALDIELSERELHFKRLPSEFDGFRLLHISDLHIDGMPELKDKMLEKIMPLEFDLCLLGGDYRFHNSGNTRNVCDRMRSFISELIKKNKPVAGILGNHDEYEIAKLLDQAGVAMLINESMKISRNGADIFVCGLDDCHYYSSQNIADSLAGIPTDSFKIVLSHSPELYAEAEKAGFDLYLAGHTHGGQICPVPGFPVLIQAKIPRSLASGIWNYKNLTGLTNRGAGSSGAPARFNCPPEIALITLRKEPENEAKD